MSVCPGSYNINLPRRADYTLELRFKDGLNAPINLVGWDVYAQVWDKLRSTKYSNFTVTYINRVAGNVSLTLTDTQTSSLPDECFYDVMLENPSGMREYYLKGIIYVFDGYTAP